VEYCANKAAEQRECVSSQADSANSGQLPETEPQINTDPPATSSSTDTADVDLDAIIAQGSFDESSPVDEGCVSLPLLQYIASQLQQGVSQQHI